MAASPVAAPSSEFEATLQEGFVSLRFPAGLEARFHLDKAAERLTLLQLGLLLSVILSACMLLPDCLMVPDQFSTAVRLRLWFYAPMLGACALVMPRMPHGWREWLSLSNSTMSALIIAHLCLRSADAMAPAYLVSLSLILLFNGSVTRVRFRQGVMIALMVISVYGAAALAIPGGDRAVMMGMSLVMVATAIFTLYGSYWQEREERTNWLMHRHEQLLLDKLERGNLRLDQLTRFDPLTEIANRRHFDDFLEQVWRRAQQGGHPVALMMMDIDHFKLYNDHYGHPVGDACLKEVAATMNRHLRRPGDLVARFGGEEFIAVLSRTNLAEAMAAAERVREAIWQLGRPHEAAGTQRRVTVSIGVASLDADAAGASTTRLIAMADEALYQAKSRGRNQAFALAGDAR